MIPRSTYNANSTVHTKSGTCSSVSYVLRCASPITARPATSIATLRCETLSEQVRQRLTDALTHKWPTPPAPALIRESDHSAASILDFRARLGDRCKLCSVPCRSSRGICAVAAKKNGPPTSAVAATICRVRFYSSMPRKRMVSPAMAVAATTFRVRF